MSLTYPPQAGGMQPPGIAHGQPMGPAQGHPGPVGHPMAMHPGVSGAAGSHVSQAGPMMAGIQIQPGVGGPGVPSAHALSHLTPNQQMMPQQMQAAIAQNPTLQMHIQQQQQQQQQHQHQLMLLRRQHQLQQMQQQNQGGIPMAFSGSMNPGPNPQQMTQLPAATGAVNLPAHAHQQHAMLQNPAMQQRVQQASHAATHTPQSLAAQQQQHLSMQHATSQGSNQGQVTPSAQPSQPSQQPGPPMRPPTAMGGPQNQPSPAQAMNQQQQVPPQTQPPQQTPTSAPQPPTPQPQAVGPQPNAQQGQQAQQQSQGQQNQQQNQQQGQQGAQQGQMQQNIQQQNQQRQRALQQQQSLAQLRFQQQQQSLKQNDPLVKLFKFAEKIGSFRSDQRPNDMAYWRSFIDEHFVEDGSLQLTLTTSQSQNGKIVNAKAFEISAPSLPRYFWMQYDGQVEQIQIVLSGSIEKTINENYHCARAEKARMLYWFKDGTQVVWTGYLTALYRGSKMETLKFETLDQQQYLPRGKLEELCAQASPDQNKSPRMTKKSNPRNQQKQPQEPAFDMRKLPPSPVNDMGVTEKTQQFLELCEPLSLMKDLMYFSQEHPELSVSRAIHVLVDNYKTQSQAIQQPINSQQMAAQQQFLQQNPQINMGPNSGGQPPGSRTPNAPMHNRPPGIGNENFVNMSPAMQNSLLPAAANGSPHISGPGGLNPGSNLGQTHTPSPAQANMPPPMAPQASQAGSAASGSGMSQNTSPNQSTKRRRSTVAQMKSEDDGGGGDVNGTPSGGQVKKATPRIPNKRMKAN